MRYTYELQEQPFTYGDDLVADPQLVSCVGKSHSSKCPYPEWVAAQDEAGYSHYAEQMKLEGGYASSQL